MNDTRANSQRLDEVIAEFLHAEEAGEAPSAAALLAAHPDLADGLREFLADRSHVHGLAGIPGTPPRRQFVPPKVRYFGDYELLEEIARGGMGVVYKARQTSLNRTVAIKMILSGHLASDEDVKRFKTEAEAAGNLRHSGIVAVHEVGLHDGHHYFSMDLIEGRSLAELVRENPLPARKAAETVQAIAEAVEYAHRQGTLHRDLKPSNVLIDADGAVHVTDFGLAMRVEGDDDLTRTGQVLGTPAYMSPEQAQAQRGLIGPASDIYSLGVILYELLTGRPPFKAESSVQTLQQVIGSEPVPPRQLNSRIPRDLETICLKCLQKEPHRRYTSAERLAKDLAQFLNGAPISARPVGRLERVWRWCRRNPRTAVMLGALAVLLAGITIVSPIVAGYQRRLRGKAEELVGRLDTALGRQTELTADLQAEQHRTEQALAREHSANLAMRRYLYIAHMNLVEQAWERGDVDTMIELLERYRPRTGSEEQDLRGFEWHYWRQFTKVRPHTLNNPVISSDKASTRGLVASADGELIGCIRSDLVMFYRVNDPDAGWRVLGTESVLPRAMTFSPDARTLAAGTNSGRLLLWDLETGDLTADFSVSDMPIDSMDWSPDGSAIALGDRAGNLHVWDVASGEPKSTTHAHNGSVGALCYSPSGEQIATGGSDRMVCVWSTPDNQSVPEILQSTRHLGYVGAAAWSSDGRWLASAGTHTNVLVRHDLSDGQFLQGHTGDVRALTFLRDGVRLATAGADNTIRIWDAASGAMLLTLHGHRRTVTGLAAAPNNRLYSLSLDDTCVWQIPAELPQTIIELSDTLRALDYAGDPNLLIECSEVITCYDPRTGRIHQTIPAGGGGRFRQVWFSGDRQRLLCNRTSGSERLPPALVTISRESMSQVELPYPAVAEAALSDDGNLIAVWTGSDFISLWDVNSGSERNRLEHSVPVGAESLEMAFAPDGRRLAVTVDSQQIVLWDPETGRPDHEVAMTVPGERIDSVGFTPDGAALVAVIVRGAQTDIRVWDDLVGSIRMSTSGSVAGVSNDGRMLAVGAANGDVSLWNLQDGSRRALLSAHQQAVYAVEFSPDSRMLASGSADGTVVLSDVETSEPVMTLAGHDTGVAMVRFTANAEQLLSVTRTVETTRRRLLKVHLWHAPRDY